MKKQNGITLIVLIITIVIMLILASTSLYVVKNGGLFESAGDAKTKYTEKAMVEQIKTLYGELQTKKLSNSSINSCSYLQENLETTFGTGNVAVTQNNSVFTIIIQNNGIHYSFSLPENGKIEISKLLPDNYQQVAYIESSGTEYIDTAIMPQYGMEVNMNLAFTSIVNDSCIIGSTTKSGTRCFISLYQTQGFSFGATDYYNDTGGLLTDFMYSLKGFWDYGNSSLYVNNTNIATVSNENMLNNTYPITLFCRNLEGTKERFSKIKLYSCQILDKNEIVRDFIPCYSTTTVTNVDNVSCPANTIGLYDLVNNKFYTNKGSGTFSAGPTINYEL